MYLKPEHELEISSLCSCWDGPRKTTLEPRAHGSTALWSSFVFIFASGRLSITPKQSGPWLYLPVQDYDPQNAVLSLLPHCLWRRSTRAPPLLSASLPTSLAPHTSCDNLASPRIMGSFEEWAVWLQLRPRWCQLIILSHINSVQAQVDAFLINEAFVLHHKTIEEYPSHSNELCPKVNYKMTFPGSRQRRPGVQASPDNCLPEILAGGNKDSEAHARGHLGPEPDIQSCRSCCCKVFCPGIRTQWPFLLCLFRPLSSLPMSSSVLTQKSHLLIDLDMSLKVSEFLPW